MIQTEKAPHLFVPGFRVVVVIFLPYFTCAKNFIAVKNPFLEEANVKANGFFHVMVSFWKLFHHSCDVNPFVFYDVGIFQISFLQLFARKRQARNEATRVGHLLWWFVVVISVVVDDLRLMVDSCLIVSFF